MFFPKGTQWDAFVLLKEIIAEAKADVLIVDAWCGAAVFHMLPTGAPLNVRILCSKNAEALAIEASRFAAQHTGVTIEIRKTRDFHDRFVVLDRQVCVHVGASLKDAGKTAFMVNKIEDDTNRQALSASIDNAWTLGTAVP